MTTSSTDRENHLSPFDQYARQEKITDRLIPIQIQDILEESKLDELRVQKSCDQPTQTFFGLTEEEIFLILQTIEFSSKGFDASPGFQSPFYFEEVDHPVVKLPDLIPAGKDQIDHEFNHGLLYGVCKKLFENEKTWKQAVELVKNEVLLDERFIQHTKDHGSPSQKKLISLVQTYLDSDILSSRESVKALSWQLGALVYQHAWFVDPGMIEAVGSYHNHGVFLKATLTLNHWFGKIFMEGEDVMEGYRDTHCQDLFKAADPLHKAILIKKSGYQRKAYFSA